MTKPSSKCQICHSNIAIYYCPRCSTSTCSLKCCKAHKTTTRDGSTQVLCNGKRDRTKFCSLKGFDDAQLASDYHFLEDVLTLSEGSKRLYDDLTTGSSCGTTITTTGSVKRSKLMEGTFRSGNVELGFLPQEEPAHPLLQAKHGKGIVQILANEVGDAPDVSSTSEEYKALTICSPHRKKAHSNIDHLVRRAELKGINLLRMPPGMQRRLLNTSKYNKKNDCITWKLELHFHSRENGAYDNDTTNECITTVESSLVDSSTLAKEIGKHLDILPTNVSTRSALKPFVSAPRESLLLFMKCLPCSSVAPKYFQLDPNQILAECLRGKTIIEYPTVEVVTQKDRDRFPLMIGEIR